MSRLLDPVKSIIKGAPFAHMWFLYMLLGLYIITPVVIRFRKSVAKETFTKIVCVFFVVATIGGWTSVFRINWGVGYQCCYLGYFMVGYEIRRWANAHKNNKKGLCYIGGGIVAEMVVACLRYLQALGGVPDRELKYKLVEPLCPLIAVAALLIFTGFSLLQIHRDYRKLASYTFFIYLIHMAIWDIGEQIIKALFGIKMDNRIVMPVSIICVFLLSYFVSCGYMAIWRYMDRKFSLSDKLCILIRLEERKEK